MVDESSKKKIDTRQINFYESKALKDKRSEEDILDIKEFLIEKRVPEYRPFYKGATLENLVGLSQDFKERLIRPIISRMIDSTNDVKDLRPLSFIFEGMPGVGKSVTSRVLANSFDTELKTLQLANIQSKWVGEGEHNFHNFIEDAMILAESYYPRPVVIRCEEAEVLLRSKKAYFGKGSKTDGYGELLPILLSHLSGDYLNEEHSRSFLLWIFNVNEKEVIGKALRSRSIPFNFPLPDPNTCAKLLIYGTLGKGYLVKDYREIDWKKLGNVAFSDNLSHRQIIRACEISKSNAVMRDILGSKDVEYISELVSDPSLVFDRCGNYSIREADISYGLKEVIKQKAVFTDKYPNR